MSTAPLQTRPELQIPAELTEREQWVTWKRVEERTLEGKSRWAKPPFSPRTGAQAYPDRPRTWGTYEEAIAACPDLGEQHGIGFELGVRPGGQTFIDLDHCRTLDEDGRPVIDPWAWAIVRRFASYTEISPSGTGLHIWIRGTIPDRYRDDKKDGKRRGYETGVVEVYSARHYATVTGRHLEGTPLALAERSEELAAFMAELWPGTAPSPRAPATGAFPTTDDAEVLARCRNNKTWGEKFRRLYDDGNFNSYLSQSEADFDLLKCLAYATDKHPEQMRRLFSQSPLGQRKKWARDPKRQDSEIANAIAATPRTWSETHAATSRKTASSSVTNGNGHAPPYRDEEAPPAQKRASTVGGNGNGHRPSQENGNGKHAPEETAPSAELPAAETAEQILAGLDAMETAAAAMAAFDLVPRLARLPLREWGKAKLLLKQAAKDLLNLNDLEAAVKDERERLKRDAAPAGSPGGMSLAKIQSDGLVRTLAEEIQSEDPFAVDAGAALYHYVCGVYVPDGELYVARRVKALLNASGQSKEWSSHLAEEVVKYIGIDARALWEQPPLHVINLQSGLLEWRTGRHFDHRPDFLTTVQLPVSYDPAATCPAWEEFTEAIFPADSKHLVWEIFAWLLTPDTSVQKVILLSGAGRNGKSTFITGLRHFLGKRNVTARSLQSLEEDRFATASLLGKLANLCPDLPSTRLESTSTFKKITGGDELTGEHKYAKAFDFVPFAKLVFSANHYPRSADASEAFWRRWTVIPFERTFENTDQEHISRTELDRRLADPRELSGVLNRALEVLPSLLKRGDFTDTPSTRAAWERFRETTDPLAIWLDQHTVTDSEASIPCDELRKAYSAACRDAGRPAPEENQFTKPLLRLRPQLAKARPWSGPRQIYVWKGIGWKDAER
jgi:P4 family phage/plasmid primase-like protien